MKDIDPAKAFKEAVLKAPPGSIFNLEGGAGTGKTYNLNQVVPHLNNVITFAFTGDAALLAKGKTGSSLFGIPSNKRLNPDIHTGYAIKRARETDPSCKSFKGRWCKKTKEFKVSDRQHVLEAASWIVLDEKSQEPCDHMDFIDAVMRDAKKKPHLPFGGCCVILVGDRGQIPPVIDDRAEKELRSFGYTAPFDALCARVFEKAEMQTFKLNKIWRQKNPIDGNILNRIRIGRTRQQDLDRINKNVVSDPPNGSTVLCCENKDSHRINIGKLRELQGEEFVFKPEMTGTVLRAHKRKEAKAGRMIDASIRLKTGCRVIVASNGWCKVDGERIDYVNGDQGVFKGVDKHNRLIVLVDRLHDYITLKCKTLPAIDYSTELEEMVDDDGNVKKVEKLIEKKVGSYSQFPIKLGYAMSGHKSQGKTLEIVHLSLGTSYRSRVLDIYGYIYVLLSRPTDLDNLTLDRPLTMQDIRTSPELIKDEEGQQYEWDL